MVVMAPKDEQELRDMLYTAIEYKNGPIALRYPRSNALGVPLRSNFTQYEIGKGEIVRKGKDIAILAVGTMVHNALEAAKMLEKSGIQAEVVNMRFIKPVDRELLRNITSRIKLLMTVEDNVVSGGFGGGVLEALSEMNITNVQVKLHGLPDSFVEHGSIDQLYHILKLDAEGIAEIAQQMVQEFPELENHSIPTTGRLFA